MLRRTRRLVYQGEPTDASIPDLIDRDRENRQPRHYRISHQISLGMKEFFDTSFWSRFPSGHVHHEPSLKPLRRSGKRHSAVAFFAAEFTPS